MNQPITSLWIRPAKETDVRPLPGSCLLREEQNGVTLLSFCYDGAEPLDMDEGAGITLRWEEAPVAFMADYRHSEYWCRPAFGSELKQIPDETQGLLLRHGDGRFTAVLPVVSETYKCVLRGEEDGTLTARLFSWYEGLTSCRGLALALKTGENPYALLRDCCREALKALNNGCAPREERQYPEVFEYLGWCSWDALQIRVDEAGLLEKCREFQQKGIPVRWAIIDDMWAEVHSFYGAKYDSFDQMVELMHQSPLYEFEGDPKRFPHKLAGCIERMKAFGLKVGVWHPTTGYWFGIDPEGPLFQRLKDCLIQAPDGRWVHSPELGKAFSYYHELHQFLKKSGADFLKIDNQSMSRRFFRGVMPVGQAARNLHTALEASCGTYFGNRLINCMGMGSEDLWNRPFSAVSRCSDDFLPDNRPWFTKHILQCSYNSLIQGQFLWCDWDMWWTNDRQAVKNSVLRAVSGGPVYVSDKIGDSRPEVLWPLMLADGRILRADRPAVPTVDCLTENPETSGRLFKLQSRCGSCGVIAAFNLDAENRPVTGHISPAQAEGLDEEEYVIYEHFTRAFRIVKREERLPVELPTQDDFALYVIVPYRNGFAPIGLCGKFLSPKTIASADGETVRLKEGGTFAFVKDGRLVLEEREG